MKARTEVAEKSVRSREPCSGRKDVIGFLGDPAACDWEPLLPSFLSFSHIHSCHTIPLAVTIPSEERVSRQKRRRERECEQREFLGVNFRKLGQREGSKRDVDFIV
ncbi:hypothetical protein L1887_28005 [Cichorium endivia]|nr:hypothetical protein L1887_28005 [Cichorium endivia]